MKLKKQRRKLGKEIRSKTGVDLPIAMRVAKLIIRNGSAAVYDIPYLKLLEGSNAHVRDVPFFCGFECCGREYAELVGPKGSYRL
jgi:hypothetical protein